jgi:hypothetical protein
MKTRKRNSIPRFTDEERAEFKKKRIERKSKLTLAFQLGYYVGEQIVDRFLPTLSCDMLQTRKVISVTAGEGDECRRLNDVWFGKVMSFRGDDEAAKHKATEKEWNELRAYHEMLEDKYLKDTIECHFSLLNVDEKDMSDFKKGIGVSLWDCDCSHYSCSEEDIDVKDDEDAWFSIITLKRSKEVKTKTE